ncbi:MAG: GLPGLI family protein [Bacteroidota bacterium]
MKKTVCVLIVFILSQHIYAQTNRKNRGGRIDYATIQRRSLYIPGAANTMDTASLYFNDTASVYVISQKLPTREEYLRQLASSPAEYREAIVDEIMRRLEKHKQNFYYHKGGSDIVSYPWDNPAGDKSFCVFDTIPSFTWELLPDTTTILGFACQKAVFKSRALIDNREREFTAWFTPDIALAYGPFRFFGLPGMILELENKYFAYKAVSINLPISKEGEIAINCCSGLPTISKAQVADITGRQQADYSNMKKLAGDKN